MNFQITEDDIMAIPEAERGPWLETLERIRQRENFIREACERGDWHNALCMCESQERAAVLIQAGAAMKTKRQLRELLDEWWSVTEAWSGDPELRQGMYHLIERAAPVIVSGERELPSLIGPLTVYRGNLSEIPHGMGSWTMDRKIAEQFASMAKSLRGRILGMWREDGWPTIWKATVDGSDVLGFFDDRGEREIVTAKPYNIEKIAEAVR